MDVNISVARVLNDASKIMDVWNANPDFTLGTTTKDVMTTAITTLATAHAAVETKRTEMTDLLNQRDSQIAAMTQLVTRARSGVRAVYGPDSSQYEQAGGTRTSDRQVRRSSSKATTATVQAVATPTK